MISFFFSLIRLNLFLYVMKTKVNLFNFSYNLINKINCFIKIKFKILINFLINCSDLQKYLFIFFCFGFGFYIYFFFVKIFFFIICSLLFSANIVLFFRFLKKNNYRLKYNILYDIFFKNLNLYINLKRKLLITGFSLFFVFFNLLTMTIIESFFGKIINLTHFEFLVKIQNEFIFLFYIFISLLYLHFVYSLITVIFDYLANVFFKKLLIYIFFYLTLFLSIILINIFYKHYI